MKVNMTPNPLDVVTIHASQGDTEARQWEFELHNNGELIDTSEITEQLFFKAYKGGTEQLLPENTSTPTTSPFKGDIRYPQGLLTDQEFTYRQSPTEEDGLAKITDIKGNTLVWNQLINATDGSGTIVEGVTYTTSNGVITLNGTPTSDGSLVIGGAFSAKANHKYLLKGCASGGGPTKYQLFVSQSSVAFPAGNRLQDFGGGKIATALGDEDNLQLRLYVYSSSPTFSNTKFIPQIFDLTKMGLDTLTDDEVKQWFADYYPLPYYQYDVGSLLSFNGNGIKTVGKNLFDENSVLLSQGFVKQNDGSYYMDNLAALSNPIVWKNDAHINGAINVKFKYKNISTAGSQGLRIVVFFTDDTSKKVYSPVTSEFALLEHRTNSSKTVDRISWDYGSSANSTYIKDFIISVDNISYEPYTSSTLSLPISTYFPTGMKSAGSVYDELTPNKAITRVGQVTLNGSEDWRYPDSSGNCWMSFNNMPVVTDYTKTMTANVTVAKRRGLMTENSITGYEAGTTNYLYFRIAGSEQTPENVKAYLQANPVTLNYELKTPTETPITTASLVTENAEIPLSNNDGVLIGKCTEQLSAEPGFIDAKIKISDGDGECYSNKLQLHVERSPQ